MKNNKHTQAIPNDVLAQVQAKTDEIRELLAPYMLAMTPAERRGLLKMGPKTINFVEKSYDFAKQNPNLVPPFLDMGIFGNDFGNAHGLWTLVNSLRQLYQNANDTEMAAGSEALQAALVFYNSVKKAAAQNVPGAKAVNQELKVRFPRGKRKASEPMAIKNEAPSS